MTKGKIPEPTWKRRIDRERIRAIIEDAKTGKPCIDCKRSDLPARILEFHHVGGVKRFAISSWQKFKATEQDVLDEIAKCVLVCPTCHKLRHL